ncbi:MAG: hypothetical protein ABI740_09580 [Alphaproteobacteria bacterium]
MTEDLETPDGLNLAERIRRLASGRTTLDVAQFQFIGLTDIRARYGDGWIAKRDRVQAIARHFIAKRINPEDVMIPGADGFLVVFGRRTGLLADAAAERISKSLNDFFIGSDPDDIDVRFEARRKAMSIEDLEAAFADMIAPDWIESALPDGPPALELVRMGFQPAWDARREALTTWIVRPMDPRTDYPVNGYHYDAVIDAPHQFAEFDELMLRDSEDAMRGLFASGRKALMTTALHVTSLQSANTLTKLIGIMAGFDKKLVRYRIIRIAGIEPGFPRIYLQDICRALRSRVPNIVFSFDWREPDIASALALQPVGVGFPLPADATSGTPRPDMLARIRLAAETCHHHHTPFFVDGSFGQDLAQRFAADGVDMLASPKIWPIAEDLGGAGKWPAAKLGPAQDSAA